MDFKKIFFRQKEPHFTKKLSIKEKIHSKKYRRNLDIYKRLYETTMNIMTELKSSTN